MTQSQTPPHAAQEAHAQQTPPASYEEASTELDALVQRMESGQMPLEELLVNYRRGAYLLNFCRQRLEALEQQVHVLENTQLKPWVASR